MTTSPRLIPLPMFADNYLWLLVNDHNEALAVDVGDYAVLDAYLQAYSLTLTTVLITHHHADHCAGLAEVHEHHPRVPVYGPGAIAGITHPLAGDTSLDLPGFGRFSVMDVPGHTRIHLAYHVPAEKILFCGDTLFSAGCGRIFDGDAASLFNSLARIAALPDRTRICPAHEYTLGNLDFALAVEPGNHEALQHRDWCRHRRARGLPTLPAELGAEKTYNPFLRCHLLGASARELTGEQCRTPLDTFVALRRCKDNWPR